MMAAAFNAPVCGRKRANQTAGLLHLESGRSAIGCLYPFVSAIHDASALQGESPMACTWFLGRSGCDGLQVLPASFDLETSAVQPNATFHGCCTASFSQETWYALVANSEFMFNDVQNEALAEQLREKKRFYGEQVLCHEYCGTHSDHALHADFLQIMAWLLVRCSGSARRSLHSNRQRTCFACRTLFCSMSEARKQRAPLWSMHSINRTRTLMRLLYRRHSERWSHFLLKSPSLQPVRRCTRRMLVVAADLLSSSAPAEQGPSYLYSQLASMAESWGRWGLCVFSACNLSSCCR